MATTIIVKITQKQKLPWDDYNHRLNLTITVSTIIIYWQEKKKFIFISGMNMILGCDWSRRPWSSKNPC